MPFSLDWQFDGRQSQRIFARREASANIEISLEKDAQGRRIVGTFCRNFRADTRNNRISLLHGDGDHVEDGNGPNHLLTNEKEHGRPGTTSITSIEAPSRRRHLLCKVRNRVQRTGQKCANFVDRWVVFQRRHRASGAVAP